MVTRSSYRTLMTREPAKRLPEAIIHGRDLLNELSTEKIITLRNSNRNWSENGINCFPFDGKISYSRENLEFRLEITVGRIFDVSGVEILETLPLPVNYFFSLDPVPVFTVSESIAVTPNSTKSEIWSFLQITLAKTLMATHTFLVSDTFEQECRARIATGNFPNSQSAWDYFDLAKKILSNL